MVSEMVVEMSWVMLAFCDLTRRMRARAYGRKGMLKQVRERLRARRIKHERCWLLAPSSAELVCLAGST